MFCTDQSIPPFGGIFVKRLVTPIETEEMFAGFLTFVFSMKFIESVVSLVTS